MFFYPYLRGFFIRAMLDVFFEASWFTKCDQHLATSPAFQGRQICRSKIWAASLAEGRAAGRCEFTPKGSKRSQSVLIHSSKVAHQSP